MSAAQSNVLRELNPITRLTRDLTQGAQTLGDDEVRFLVDSYYNMQELRKRSANQLRSLEASEEPHSLLRWFFVQNETLENQVKRALKSYVESHPVGQWMISIRGIGPVISAGLLAHIDITQCPTVGHIWSFAGIDGKTIWPSKKDAEQWLVNHDCDIDKACAHFRRRKETILKYTEGKNTVTALAAALARRPWNGQLKTLCWKIGESFVKIKGHEEGYYGHIYTERHTYEHQQNAQGVYADQAAEILRRAPTHKQRAIYEQGKLPDGHIHERAKRYAVKLFLAHLHEVWYQEVFKTKPPLPYAIAHLGHAHYIKPPNT